MDRITRRSRLTAIALLMAMCGMPVCAYAFQPAAPAAPVTPTPTSPAVQAEIPLAERLEELAKKLDRKLEEQHIAGAAIAIVHNGKVVMARGFGVRDIESKTPADEHTQFAIGSQTKAFTSMLVSLLADEGKMSWDDNPAKHVKGFKLFDADANEKVTLRDLCSHQTGLPRTDLLWASGKATKPEMMVRLAFAEPTHKFRTQWQYNNTMFMVAGMAAESVSGKTWQELIKTRIFEPLGMTSSNTDIADMQKNPAKALGYAWDEEKNTYTHLPMRKVTCDGAGAINSTVTDMAKWLTMLTAGGEVNGKRFVSEQMLAEMWKPQISMGGDHSYGLGWMLSNWNGKRMVDHGGNIDGFFTACGMLPDEKLGVIFMGSATYAPLQGEVLPMVWETFFPKPAAVAGAAPSVESMQEYLGNYNADFLPGSPNCAVSVVDGKLHINVPGQMNFELLPPTAEGKWAFAMVPQQIQLRFDRAEDGKVSGITMYQAGMEFELPRMGEDGKRAYAEKPGPFTAAQLNDFAGTYHFEQTGLDWKVVVKDGKMGVDVPQQRLFMLKWPDEAGKWSVKLLPASCMFNRDDSGKITSMTWFQGGEAVLKRTGDAAPSTLPTIEDVVALREKSSNLEKVRALGNLAMEGKVRVVNQGVEGTFSWIANMDGRMLQDIDMGVFGVIRASYDGTQGWTESVGDSLKEMTGETLEEVRRGGRQIFALDPRTQFDRVEVIDAREEKGEKLIMIRGTYTKPEKTVTLYLDASTGLPVREDSSMLVPGLGNLPMTLRYSDYRDVEGVLLPHKVSMHTDANGAMEFTMDKVSPRQKETPGMYVLKPRGK